MVSKWSKYRPQYQHNTDCRMDLSWVVSRCWLLTDIDTIDTCRIELRLPPSYTTILSTGYTWHMPPMLILTSNWIIQTNPDLIYIYFHWSIHKVNISSQPVATYSISILLASELLSSSTGIGDFYKIIHYDMYHRLSLVFIISMNGTVKDQQSDNVSRSTIAMVTIPPWVWSAPEPGLWVVSLRG